MSRKLPRSADAYVAVIGVQNAGAMRSVAHKGVVQGGRLGKAKEPRFQVTCSDGSVLRYRASDGRAETDGLGAKYLEQNLSSALNHALAQLAKSLTAIP